MTKLSAPYSRPVLEELLEGLLPGDLKIFDEPKEIRPSEFIKKISKALMIAEVPSLDLAIFEFHHSSAGDPRIELSKEIFRMLAESFKHRALVVLSNSESKQWRFSLMTIDLDLNEKGKVKHLYSNPRRSSYMLGSEAKIVTPTRYLCAQGPVESFEALQKRFSVEVVNNEFYKEIAKLYDELVGVEKTEGELKHPNQASAGHEFVIRLLGRIIFCWFLREKHGASGVPLIPEVILSSAAAEQNNYYHTVLAPLFFETLNKSLDRREEKFQRGAFKSIPYLNGGLFNQEVEDHYRFDKLKQLSTPDLVSVPDKWLRKLFMNWWLFIAF